jgi:hypothetical protein
MEVNVSDRHWPILNLTLVQLIQSIINGYRHLIYGFETLQWSHLVLN